MITERTRYELIRVIESYQIGEQFTTSDAMSRWRYKREITQGKMRSYLRTSDRVRYVKKGTYGHWERIE